MQYYLIKDLNKLGKLQDSIPYIFEKGQGWIPDHKNILMDRIVGYDGESLGCMSMLSQIDAIDEDVAQRIMEN